MKEDQESISFDAREFLMLALILMSALAIRLDFLVSGHFIIDSDEAIVGLMAKHILDGKGIPIFYYGQHYMGSLEALLAAGVFSIFGVSAAALKIVPLFFSLILIVLVYALGRALGGKQTGRLAALFLAIPPSTLVVWSAKARGGFIELIVIGAVAVLLTLWWFRKQSSSLFPLFFVGFVLGVGWWVNNQIIYFIPPILWVILSRLVHLPEPPRFAQLKTAAGLGLAGFLLGGVPYWVDNIQSGFASFSMFKSCGGLEIGHHLEALLHTALPILLGARRFWQFNDVFPGSTEAAYIVYGGLLLLVVGSRWREMLQAVRFRVDPVRPVEVIVLFLVCTILVFSISSFGSFVLEPRYLLPLYLATSIIAAIGVSIVAKSTQRGAGAILALILSMNLLSCYSGGRALPGEPFVFEGQRVSKDNGELISWLRDNHYHWVRTNYWIGYRLAFETREDVKFMMFGEPFQVRIPYYMDEGAQLPEKDKPFVLVPAQAAQFEKGLIALRWRYEKTTRSGYIIFYDVYPMVKEGTPIPSSELIAEASAGIETAKNAVDGSMKTRWGSGRHQEPGMVFVVSFKSQRKIDGIKIALGEWQQDYPRGLQINAVMPNGQMRRILSSDTYEPVRYVLGNDKEFTYLFDAIDATEIILQQTGTHPIFDWSIAELTIYGE